MTDYQIPASVVRKVAQRQYARDKGGPANISDFEPDAEADLRTAFDELGMEKQRSSITGERRYRLVSRWMPVEKPLTEGEPHDGREFVP